MVMPKVRVDEALAGVLEEHERINKDVDLKRIKAVTKPTRDKIRFTVSDFMSHNEKEKKELTKAFLSMSKGDISGLLDAFFVARGVAWEIQDRPEELMNVLEEIDKIPVTELRRLQRRILACKADEFGMENPYGMRLAVREVEDIIDEGNTEAFMEAFVRLMFSNTPITSESRRGFMGDEEEEDFEEFE